MNVIEMKDLEASARNMADVMDDTLRDHHGLRIGFALFLFEFGGSGGLTYVSNATRSDMVRVVEEWISRERNKT